MIRVDDNLYKDIHRFVNDRMGLYFSENRKQDLIRGLNHASETFGYKDINTCIKQMISINWSEHQIQTLASYLTVGETFFFRHKEQIDYIFNVFLAKKELLTKKKIKIWSAACCSGEEAYSFAILFKEKFSIYSQWDIEIIGTDINPVFLKKAQSGIYTEYSFRKLPNKLINKYFNKTAKNRYEISDSIKKMVTFKYLNLASNTYPAQSNNTCGINIIFCRNVFIYFQQNTIDKVIKRYRKCLTDNGILIVDPAETFMVSHDTMYKEHFINPTVFIKKQKKHQQPASRMIGTKKIEQLLKNIKITEPVKIKETINQKLSTHKKSASQTTIPANKIKELKALFKAEKYYELIKTVNSYELIKQSRPNRIFLVNLLAKCYKNMNNNCKALECCKQFIELDKFNPEAYFLCASILLENNNLSEAINKLNKTLYMEPNYIMAHFMLGNIQKYQGNYEKSKKHMINAANLLKKEAPDKILDDSENLTAEKLHNIIKTLLKPDGIQL